MNRRVAIFLTLCLNVSGVLLAQSRAADPAQRYFRLICLVHLTGSGQAGDPVVPEYVVQGTAVAVAAQQAAMTAGAGSGGQSGGLQARREETPGSAGQSGATAPPPMASRPGYLAWSMLKSDDATMAIIQIVAADRHAFDSILADTRPEIRVFEIGKDTPAAIQAEMQNTRRISI